MRQKQGVFSLFLLSPSARRAWIEIRHLSFARDAPELHRQQLCMEQRLQCMNKDVLMYLLFR